MSYRLAHAILHGTESILIRFLYLFNICRCNIMINNGYRKLKGHTIHLNTSWRKGTLISMFTVRLSAIL